MIRTRVRKVLRDVWSRKVRTLLVSTSIFIGVLGVVTLFSTGELLVNQLEKDIQQERLAMVRITVALGKDAEADNEAALTTVRDLEGVTAVEGRAIYPLFWRLPGDDALEDATIVSHTEALGESFLEPPRLVEGNWPEAATTANPPFYEIGVERRMADKHDLQVGDMLEVRMLSAAGDNGEFVTAPAKIVGIIFQPYQYNGLVSSDALVFAAYSDAQQIAAFKGFNTIFVRFETYKQAQEQRVALQQAISQNTPYRVINTFDEDPAENSQIESTRSTNRILAILAVIALIVSGFLVFNVVGAIVGEQRRQIGTMKSLGATRADNFFIYSGMALLYGIIGVIPGVLLGIPAGYFAAQGLAVTSNTVLEEFGVSISAIVIGVVMGLGIPLLSSFIPVFNGTRVTILEAMTDFGIDAKYGRSRLDRLVGQLPIPLGLRAGINDAFQKKWRLAMTGMVLLIANASFMGIFGVFSGLNALVDKNFETFGSQIVIQPNEGQDAAQVVDLLQNNIEGLKTIEPSVTLAIDIEGYTPPTVTAGPPGITGTGFNTANPDLFKFDYAEGNGWNDDPNREGVVITTNLQKGVNLGEGDTITVIVGGVSQAFEIIGVANWPFDAVWFRWEDLARFGGLTTGPEQTPYPNSFDVILEKDELSADEVDDKIDEMRELLLKNGITGNYQNNVALAELISQIVTIFGVILSLAAFLIAAVGAVGLLTTLSISVFERQKEIGVMRSVGATSRNIVTQFLIEGLIVGVVSWILAVPLSYLISRGLLSALPFGDEFQIDYPIYSLLVGLAGMVFIVTLASLWPSLAAARKTVSNILRYQ